MKIISTPITPATVTWWEVYEKRVTLKRKGTRDFFIVARCGATSLSKLVLLNVKTHVFVAVHGHQSIPLNTYEILGELVARTEHDPNED